MQAPVSGSVFAQDTAVCEHALGSHQEAVVQVSIEALSKQEKVVEYDQQVFPRLTEPLGKGMFDKHTFKPLTTLQGVVSTHTLDCAITAQVPGAPDGCAKTKEEKPNRVSKNAVLILVFILVPVMLCLRRFHKRRNDLSIGMKQRRMPALTYQ